MSARVLDLFLEYWKERSDITEFQRESFRAKCNPAPILRDEIHSIKLNKNIHCEIEYVELQDTELQDLKREEICKFT